MRLQLALSFFLALATQALGQESRPTIIHAKVESVRDRLEPNALRDIVVDTEFTITLSGKNNISENRSRSVVRNEFGVRNVAGPSSSNSQSLGETNGKVSWRVLGPHRLQRTTVGRQFIFVMTITTDGKSTCALDAKFALQRGFEDIVARRIDNGSLARFSLPRVTAASCTIE
jgi:hypothetical protein